MTDLRKLIEAVTEGSLPEAIFHGCSAVSGHWAYKTGLTAGQRNSVFLAYNGSLDAVKALHEEMLPGWGWSIQGEGFCYVHSEQGEYSSTAGNPARAWLLSILKAYEAQQ